MIVVVCCGMLWLCAVAVSCKCVFVVAWLCLCCVFAVVCVVVALVSVFVVVFVVVCLWTCLGLCLWLCVCDCVCGCVLRSGRERCEPTLAVEVRRRRRRSRTRMAADIESNNPHLTGGEKDPLH